VKFNPTSCVSGRFLNSGDCTLCFNANYNECTDATEFKAISCVSGYTLVKYGENDASKHCV
jgi:hypothetical protein